MNRKTNNPANDKLPSVQDVKRILRDAAYVLKLTRLVKEEMLRDVRVRNENRIGNDCPQFGSAV